MAARDDPGFNRPLEGLRGLAVLWVILFHYVVLRGDLGDPWIAALARVGPVDAVIRNGYLGVDLFFMLSGFLLVLPWLRHARGDSPRPSAREFWRRRVRRIVPAYYVHLALLFCCFAPLVRGFEYLRNDILVVGWNVAAHAGFLQLTSPLTSGTLAVNGALWTLAIEAQFYLLLPLLAPLFARAPLRATVAAFGLAAAWQWGARHGLQGLVDAIRALGAHWAWPEAVVRHLLLTQLPSYLGHFALGGLLAHAWRGWRERGARPAWLPPLAGLAALVSLGVLLHVAVAPWGEHTWLLTTGVLGTVLFAAAAGGDLARRALGRGPVAFAGRVSYSAYLYHLPLLLLWNLHGPRHAGALPLYLALVFAVAWISWRYVEEPFRSAGLRGARAGADQQRRTDGERLQEGHAP